MKLFKVAISTVGCRANQADSAALLRRLDSRKTALCDESESPDLIVINTCTVTAEADRDCRKRARRFLSAFPKAKVFLVGCAVNADRDFAKKIDPRLESLSGEDGHPEALARRINAMAGAETADAYPFGLTDRLSGRTRGLIKIQTGCTHGCAYCIVPKARGPERSMTKEDILFEIDKLKEAGFVEAVVTGVQLGAWGKDIGRPGGLGRMLVDMADRFSPGRLRVSSLEPWSANDSLLEAVLQHERICPHLHLPLQHGDDGILRAMRRGYDTAFYLRIVDKMRRLNPDAALGTDVIFGFPGETEQAFQKTMETLRAISPAYLHAFTYSPRHGTRAASMEGAPPKDTARGRTREARALGETLSLAYRRAHVGRIHEVVIEEKKGNIFHGLTDTFVKVRLSDASLDSGILVSARIISARQDCEGVVP